jgi:biotin operon repressor
VARTNGLVRLQAEGRSLAEIARTIGVSRQTLYRHMDELRAEAAGETP